MMPSKTDATRVLAGLASVLLLVGVVSVAVTLFRDGYSRTVPITVMSPRAGLVMNPDARVKMRGVVIGKVDSIEQRPNGQAEIRLAMDSEKLADVPANVLVDISSSTVFGAKAIQMIPPSQPSPRHLAAGDILHAEQVTVEFNTIFQQLTSVLARVQPQKLNETLGAIATALRGRGDLFGRGLTDLDAVLAKWEPSLPALSRDLTAAPEVMNVYADSVTNLLDTAASATSISQTLIDEQRQLDALLLSATGLAGTGDQFFADNRKGLDELARLLVPTLKLTNEYGPALTCSLQGMAHVRDIGVSDGTPGLEFGVGFLLGGDRYRYPHNLPRLDAKGGPQCSMLPAVPYQARPKFYVADYGANPFEYGNQGLLWNTDALKQALFGPLDGPPRNSAEIGQGR